MEMTNTFLIAKHLNLPPAELKIAKCCLCGQEGGKGFTKREIVSSGFMDNDCLNESGEMCVYCAACLGKGQAQNEQIRMFNFLATPSRLIKLKREEIWQQIFNPPADEPFVFAVTYSHKKHISFRAPVNLPGQLSFQVRTENTLVGIEPARISPLAEVIQRWYSICKDTAEAPTWFTKKEIQYGCDNFKRIEQYGIDDYRREDLVISLYRHSALLELLCHALNKGPLSERRVESIDVSGFFKAVETPKPHKPKSQFEEAV